MKLQILALSTVLLFGAGALAQTNATPPANNNGNAVTATQPANPNNANPNGVNTTPQTVPMDRPVNRGNWHSGGGGWGLWGLLGLFGFFGLARGGRRDEVVRTTTTNLPPR